MKSTAALPLGAPLRPRASGAGPWGPDGRHTAIGTSGQKQCGGAERGCRSVGDPLRSGWRRGGAQRREGRPCLPHRHSAGERRPQAGNVNHARGPQGTGVRWGRRHRLQNHPHHCSPTSSERHRGLGGGVRGHAPGGGGVSALWAGKGKQSKNKNKKTTGKPRTGRRHTTASWTQVLPTYFHIAL